MVIRGPRAQRTKPCRPRLTTSATRAETRHKAESAAIHVSRDQGQSATWRCRQAMRTSTRMKAGTVRGSRYRITNRVSLGRSPVSDASTETCRSDACEGFTVLEGSMDIGRVSSYSEFIAFFVDVHPGGHPGLAPAPNVSPAF